MPLPRLLLLCLFGLPCAASAAAQSGVVNPNSSQPIAGAHAASPLQVPALTHIPALVERASGMPPATLFNTPQQLQEPLTLAVHNELQRQLTLAQNDRPCYAMRSYGFSADDLKSSAPRASSYSTCAPTSSVRRKDAENVTVR